MRSNTVKLVQASFEFKKIKLRFHERRFTNNSKMVNRFEEITQSDNYQLYRPEVIERTKRESDYVPYQPLL